MSQEDDANAAVTEPEYLYVVTLRITHPAKTPEVISKALVLEPDYKWQVGEPRLAPNGVALPGGGLNKETYWLRRERVSGRRLFSETVAAFLDDLEAAQEFAADLVASGGRIMIVINLPGFRNIGSTISTKELTRMASLGVDLGIEVFPQMN